MAGLELLRKRGSDSHHTPSLNKRTDAGGFILDAPALADAICHDPLLGRLKLIAQPGSDDSLLPR